MSEIPGRGLTGALTDTLSGTLSGTMSRAQAAPGRVKSWWLGRLRHQVGLILASLVAAGVVGTTFVTARAFVADKEEYVMVLGSISAPNVAEGIGKHFAHLRAQLSVFDDILLSVQRSGKSSELLQSSFKKLEGVRQIDIFDESGLVASISSSPGAGNAPAAFGPRLLGEMEKGAGRVFTSESEGARNLLWPLRVGKNLYVLQLNPGILGEYLALARPLSGLLVLNGTEVVAGTASGSALGSEAGAEGSAERDLALQVARGLQSTESGDSASQKRKVVARKVTVGEDLHALAAIAPIPGVEGLSVVVHTPAEQVSKLARALLNSSLPFIALILVLALAIGAVFTARLVKPIEELTEAAGHIGAGRWDVFLPGGSQDEIGRLVGAFSKMTRELSSREQELKRANDRIVQSERLAALGKFGAGIAHEVKNPLNSILGYAQLIQRRLATASAAQSASGAASGSSAGSASAGGDETITKYLGFIMDETRRASRIISDLLGFARQKPPQLRPCPLSELLDYAHQMILPQAEAAKVEFVRELVARDGEPALVASLDRDQMFQVLLNLCTNALHALEGRSLEGKSDGAKLRIRAERQGAEIALSVIDNGSGIAPENLSRLFEPFFSTKEVGKGTGLGLALCHGIVTQHSGRIEVYSEAGTGTEFRILLPMVG